jgi:hypothetical protein
MTTATLPPVTPAFRDAVRALAQEIGYRNVCKRIIYGSVLDVQTPRNRNGHKPNTQRMVAPWQAADALLFPKHIPGIKRNARGGLACAPPGGYQREWGDLIGVGTCRMVTQGHRKPGPTSLAVGIALEREAKLGGGAEYRNYRASQTTLERARQAEQSRR